MRLHWTPIAMGHLRAAYEYAAREKAAAAETFVEQIFGVVERLEQYPRIADRHRDFDGRRPAHSFFYPWDEYRREEMAPLQAMCAQAP